MRILWREVWFLKTAATPRPTAMAISTVMGGRLAAPRMPSVPNILRVSLMAFPAAQ